MFGLGKHLSFDMEIMNLNKSKESHTTFDPTQTCKSLGRISKYARIIRK